MLNHKKNIIVNFTSYNSYKVSDRLWADRFRPLRFP